MTRVEKTIQVNQPITTVYNQWTQFESFPQFMQGVEKVIQLDDKRLHWEADIGFVEREWDAEIVEQRPDQVIAWKAIGDVRNDGRVAFNKVDDHTTQIELMLEYEPSGFTDKLGDKLNVIDRRAEGDLENFKEFIERRGNETGGYRESLS